MRVTRSMKTRNTTENLHLLVLPHVVRDHILSFLTVEEQLDMRLVCKVTKDWIDERAKRLSTHMRETHIQYNGRNTFTGFGARSAPHRITKLYLDTNKLDVFDDVNGMLDFINIHGPTVTSVRVTRLFVSNRAANQSLFFESLSNLEHVETDEVWVANEDEVYRAIPSNFCDLMTFKLGEVKVYVEPCYEACSVGVIKEIPMERRKALRGRVWQLLEACNDLRYLRVPISPRCLYENPFDECFRLLNFIRIRTRGMTDRGFRAHQYVMKCDIENFNCCTSSMEVLLIVGARMRIQFLNVNSKVFKRGSSFCLVGIPPRARFDYIHSFISSSLVNRPFDYVQKLTFKASLIQNECIIGRDKGPVLFPSLKEFVIVIDIGVDSRNPCALYSKTEPPPHIPRNVCFPRADQVLKFFFPEGCKYPGVQTATFSFAEPVFPNQKRATPDRLGTLPVVIQCLPNIEKLTIVGWNCKRTTYFKLWHGFRKLKQLCVDSCSTMTASCLIDGNGNPLNPGNFQHLPDLEYLELRGLDAMPGIASGTEIKPALTDVITKMGLEPFSFLTTLESQPSTGVWIRSSTKTRPEASTSASIITRSVAKAMKSKRTGPEPPWGRK